MTDQAAAAPPPTMAGATFDAFRNRGKNGVLTGASLAYLLLWLAVGAGFWALSWRGYADYLAWVMEVVRSSDGAAPTPDMFQSIPPSVMNLGNVGLLYQVVYFILLAAFEAGCLRWLTRGETRGLLTLSLTAGDTWVVWASYWVWFGLLIGLYIAVFVVGLIAALVMAAMHLEPGIMAIVAVVSFLALMCAIIWAGVRLAPATATSVALQRFAFFDAWKVTRGRFWTLFGSFLLLIILYLVIGSAIAGLALIPVLSTLGPLMAEAAKGTTPTSEQIWALLLAPTNLAAIGAMVALSLLVRTIMMIALFGVNARAAVVAKAEGRIS
jgi:hypothetical protein